MAILLFIAYLPIPVSAQTGWISVVSPGKEEILSGRRAEVSVSFNTDSSDLITRIELDVDGASYGVKHLSQPQARGISSFLVDTTILGNGSHSYIVKAFCGSRLIISTSGTCKINNLPIDAIAPDLQFVGIRKGQIFKGVTDIEITAKDRGCRNPLVSVFIDKSLRSIKNTPPYVYTWDTTQYEDGKHILEACAYDESGNKSESEAVEVMVQNNGKVVFAAQPTSETAGPVKPTTITKTADASKIEPIIPIERQAKSSAARSADAKAGIVTSTNNPVAKSDRVKSDTEAAIDVPTSKSTIVASNTKVTIDKTATTVPTVEPSTPTAVEPELPSGAEPAPNMTLPTTAQIPHAPEVIASLPSGVESPAATERPATVPPVPTVVNERLMMQSELQTVDSSSTLGQKLARPQMPETAKPVKVALVPKPDLPMIQPPMEAQKIKLTLQTKKRQGVYVTELRYIVENVGGQIIAWDNKLKIVTVVVNKKKIKIKIGSSTAIIDGKTIELSGVPYINSDGRAVVDTRLLKSLLGTKLVVDERTGKCMLIAG
jgi:hypothetical protein